MSSNPSGQGAKPSMHMNPRIEQDRNMILDAQAQGKFATFKTFLKLSGPGWLQSGITLGGGSLSSSLYLGVLVGFSFLWLQPLAMILGIIMMSAISYVTLSAGERPLKGINQHISPVLGWGWLLASMMANLVWSLPQFALGTAALRQNILPGLIGPTSAMGEFNGKLIAGGVFLAICLAASMTYGAGGRGVKVFEYLIKSIVSMIVLSFVVVVIRLSIQGEIQLGVILSGLVPDLSLFSKPTASIMPHINLVDEQFQAFWSNRIVGEQRDVMISAAATAVGINMTFLLPYSMLRKGWDKHFRGLAIFDLSTGLFIPFIIATGCVVMASASQFHGKAAVGFVPDEPGGVVVEAPSPTLVGPYKNILRSRVAFEMDNPEAVAALSPEEMDARIEALPWADKRMGALLLRRDAFDLAATLEPLAGRTVANYIFGLGVMFMALSAATMLMTINGLCFCELLGVPPRGWPQRVGNLMVMVGALGPFFWTDAAPYLAVPTSVFAMVLLPIAYFAFFFLMNSEKYLGEHMPRGFKRVVWNTLMVLALTGAAIGSLWSLWSRLQWVGIALIVGFIALCVVVHVFRKEPATRA